MGWAEKHDDYYRGRYKDATGKRQFVRDGYGQIKKFTSRRAAKKAAEAKEAAERAGVQLQGERPAVTESFGDYASRWYAGQDLAPSTMQNYRRHIEEHLLPTFGETPIGEITSGEVGAWEKGERAAGYAEASIKTWRSTLHLILADAQEEGLSEVNAAARRRGRGRRAGRSRARGPEKAITTSSGILLIAERAALLAGRDDEFVATVLMGFTGLRWGETVGLETTYVRSGELRVEWQLYELDSGELRRCSPKDDSYRTIDLPSFLGGLVEAHVKRTVPAPCGCHGRIYVFRGHRPANGAAAAPGAKLVDVARRAGVSTGTVSNVLNRPDSVPEATRAKVAAAITDLGYVRRGWSGELAAHWRRSGFATWLFHPAATGWYPANNGRPPSPVPVLGEPWPGIPVRGRNATGRADSCWLPIVSGLTPHGLRHTHRTLMQELGTPPVLMDDRMGHADGSVQARYTHVTSPMRAALMSGLTELWEAALDARLALSPRSPVVVLDRLLADRAATGT